MTQDLMDAAGQQPADRAVVLYAGIFKRLWAAIVDLMVCLFLYMIAMIVLLVLDLGEAWAGAVLPLAAMLIFWLYSAGYESSAAQATPGKKASRMVVSDAHGCRLSFARASLRCLGKLVILASAGLGLIPVAFDGQKRAIDDFIAGTRVRDVEAVGVTPRPWWRKLVAPLLLLAVIGALAVMAIDAQRDFQRKSHISRLLQDIRSGLQRPYAEYYAANHRAPRAAELPFAHAAVRSVEIDASGALLLRLIQPEEALLRLTPEIGKDDSISWTCRVEAGHVAAFPARCRP